MHVLLRRFIRVNREHVFDNTNVYLRAVRLSAGAGDLCRVKSTLSARAYRVGQSPSVRDRGGLREPRARPTKSMTIRGLIRRSARVH